MGWNAFVATKEFPGQLNSAERELLRRAVLDAPKKPEVVLEVGTWLGGGSTFTILRAMGENGTGHLWGVEADSSIYERMVANFKEHVPELMHRFTPLFGFSDAVLPKWIAEQKQPFVIDMAFLDGGNHPGEQIAEFNIIDPHMPVGAQLFGHDARTRKGKWLVPYLQRLDNWEIAVHDFSATGIFAAKKLAAQPGAQSLRSAKSNLAWQRWAPLEVASRYAPRGLKKYAFSKMPRWLAGRLADGNK